MSDERATSAPQGGEPPKAAGGSECGSAEKQDESAANAPDKGTGGVAARSAHTQHPDAPPDRPKTKRERRECTRWVVTTTIEAAGVFVLILYTCFTFGLLSETRKSTEAAIKGVKRPYVLVDAIVMRPADAPREADVAGSLVWESHGNVALRIKNFGDGPARRVRIATRVHCVPADQPCPDPMDITPSEASEVVLGPGHEVSSDSLFVWKDYCCGSDQALTRLNTFRVECTYEEATHIEGSKLPSHRLFAATKILYLDQFGAQHWTQACGVWNPFLKIWDVALTGNDFS